MKVSEIRQIIHKYALVITVLFLMLIYWTKAQATEVNVKSLICYYVNINGHIYSNCENNGHYGYLEKSKEQNLVFPTVLGGFRQKVVVAPNDATAAIFKVKGYPHSRVVVRVKQNNGFMYSKSWDKIKIENFTYGGSVNSRGVGYLNRYGELSNIRIGGTARIKSKNKDKSYDNDFSIEVEYE